MSETKLSELVPKAKMCTATVSFNVLVTFEIDKNADESTAPRLAVKEASESLIRLGRHNVNVSDLQFWYED